MRGRAGRIVKLKTRRAFKSARRMRRPKLNKSYAQVSGKLVAQTILKKRRRGTRRYSRKRRYRR